MTGQTIAAVSTPDGVGALAVVRISGEKAVEYSAALCSKNLNTVKPREAVFTKLYSIDKSHLIDEAVVIVMKAPSSFTGEDTVEIFCHGGRMVCKAILKELLRAGCRMALPGEFSKRAFLNGKINLAKAESIGEVIHSKTEKAFLAASNQLDGVLSAKIEDCRQTLINIAAHIAALIDYPEEGVPDAGRDNCANVVLWELAGGRDYELVSFEPYTYQYVQLIALGGAAEILGVSQLRETYDETLTVNKKPMPATELQKIYDAAYESFVQNATDIFMDCPSRERAGWLCDSFFTSRVEKALTGKSLVERNFLENFILPASFPGVPDGMLPMCYPSDHPDGCYIPNWSMWYVLELREYLRRTGDTELVAAAKDRLYGLAAFFEKYENPDGLLQKLESWVFVEWSKANEYTQDINYPTNMLYSVFLDCLCELYDDESFGKKAENLRAVIREKSFDGEFFIDNAVLDKTGTAKNTRNRTETCQYYAFFTKTATKELYPELWDKLVNEFGPVRDKQDKHPEISRSNAFIGNYLRLDLLFAAGMYDRVVNEITDFFLPMAEKTGTLWENMTDSASCNHGFASHVICWLNAIYG